MLNYWPQVTVKTYNDSVTPPALVDAVSGRAYLHPAQETLVHDADGNLTQDAGWTYQWDGEGRMSGCQMRDVGLPLDVPLLRLAYVYDAQGRRAAKRVFAREINAAGTGREATERLRSDWRYWYDGWNLMVEKDLVSGLVRQYVWGLDLSGSLGGAGGVGGLLGVRVGGKTYTACVETNGNIMGLIDGTTGVLAARWDYEAFGITTTTVEAAGPFGHELCPFRFSSKYRDVETGLYYYGFRYYSPELGRWLSRDPMFEITGEHPEFMEEGPNLYGFVHNDPVNGYDFLGLKWRKVGKTKDERRLIWERDDPAKDTFEELAKKVDLDPQEATSWAKPDEKNSCRYTTPNVWIMVKMLRGINSFRDIYTNPGDEIGDMFTFTGSRKTVNVSSSGAIVGTINQYRGDIIGLSIYGHDDIGIVGGTAYGDFEYLNNILSAVDGNGFKLKEAHLMQCYSGAGGFDAAWKARCYKGRAKVYYGVNACGIDFGSKPKPPLR